MIDNISGVSYVSLPILSENFSAPNSIHFPNFTKTLPYLWAILLTNKQTRIEIVLPPRCGGGNNRYKLLSLSAPADVRMLVVNRRGIINVPHSLRVVIVAVERLWSRGGRTPLRSAIKCDDGDVTYERPGYSRLSGFASLARKRGGAGGVSGQNAPKSKRPRPKRRRDETPPDKTPTN